MTTESLTIPNITCGHCVAAIQTELKEIDGVRSVDGDPAAKQITVAFDSPATLASIRSRLSEINYPAEQ
jgi:copper chaperone